MRIAPRSQSLVRLFLLALILLLAPYSGSAQAPTYKVSVTTDRESALYQTGEQATFRITVSQNGKPLSEGEVQYSIDNFLRGVGDYPSGALSLKDGSVLIQATSAKPDFLRCTAIFKVKDGKPIRALGAAGFSPLKIEPSMPVPDDFDAFWTEQKKQLAQIPMNPQVTSVEHADTKLKCFDVKVECLGDAPVSGYFAKPAKAESQSLPAILWVHGAGVRSSSLANAVNGAANGMLSMDINAHGSPNGKPGDFYKQLSANELKGYTSRGRESRDTIYFKGMFVRLIRAIDFLTAQPEWDGKTVIVIGHSQGGGQALAAGGLDERVTLIASGVPAICDHTGVEAGRVNGWPKLVPNDSKGKPLPEIQKAARYVDAVNLASRCKAEAIMSVGFIDGVCPPSSCYAAYNQLQGPKEMLNYPAMGHAAPAPVKDAFFARVLKHVAEQQKD